MWLWWCGPSIEALFLRLVERASSASKVTQGHLHNTAMSPAPLFNAAPHSFSLSRSRSLACSPLPHSSPHAHTHLLQSVPSLLFCGEHDRLLHGNITFTKNSISQDTWSMDMGSVQVLRIQWQCGPQLF